jgi:hypothetical protein
MTNLDSYKPPQLRVNSSGVIPCSEYNLPAIRDQASRAVMIVLGFWGCSPVPATLRRRRVPGAGRGRPQPLVPETSEERQRWTSLYIAGGTKPVPFIPKLPGKS